MHLTAVLERAARISPDKEAIVYGDTSLTYAELLDQSRRAATVLAEHGVTPGDRVAVQTFNTPQFVVAAYGIWFAGGVLVPVNHKLAAAETAYIVKHSGALVGVVAADLVDNARTAAPDTQWLTVETAVDDLPWFDALVEQAEPLAELPGLDQDDPAQFLYTSGTTSDPKACIHTHRTVSSVAPLIVATLGYTSEDRFLISMPIWHASPLNNWLLTMIFVRGTVVLQREYHPVEFLQHVARYRPTTFFGAPIAYIAPTQLAAAGKLSLTDFDLSSVTRWLYGGAPLGADVARSLVAAYGTDQFFQVYGMSEMGPVGTVLRPHEQVTKAGSIGWGGMPGVDLRVVDPEGNDVQAPGTGEIWLRADTRMIGYHGDDDATANVFAGDWFRTGDVASVDDDGYLYIVDRLKDIIIVGGENVHSQEVEEAIRALPRIADIAVIGRPDPDWGESVVAVYATTDGEAIDVDDMRSQLESRIARYKLPREAIQVDELPRNPSGKLTKHVIRAEVLD